MNLEIIKGSENYVCQVIKLPVKVPVHGLDNLVAVTYQGNTCLVSKDTPEDELYLFFPAECELSEDFLKTNNLFRHSHLNIDGTKRGFFEDNRRVKAIKFRGVVSTGFICPLGFLGIMKDVKPQPFNSLEIGDEFNIIDGIEICKKYKRPFKGQSGFSNPQVKRIDQVVDSIFVPEHPDTSHLLKNTHKLSLDDYIAVTYKLHGTSARYYNTLRRL